MNLRDEIQQAERPHVLRVSLSKAEHEAVRRAAGQHQAPMAEVARASLRMAKVIGSKGHEIPPAPATRESSLADAARLVARQEPLSGRVRVDPAALEIEESNEDQTA